MKITIMTLITYVLFTFVLYVNIYLIFGFVVTHIICMIFVYRFIETQRGLYIKIGRRWYKRKERSKILRRIKER